MRPRRIIPIARALLAITLVAALAGCSAFQRQPREGDRVLLHVVQEDESLADVADDYYGNSRRARDIRRFNDLDRGEDPEPGAELRIPMTPKDMEALGRRRRARVPYAAGVDLVAERSFVDASIKFREAIELDPRFAEARYNLGATYQRMKAHEKALEEFKEAAELRPDNPTYCFAVGGSYFHLERYRRAADEFRRALKLDPFHLQARYSLAATLEKLGRTSEARREWRKYLDLDSTSAWADEARSRLEKLGEQ